MNLEPPFRKPVPNIQDLDMTERDPVAVGDNLVRPQYAMLSGGSGDEWIRMTPRDPHDIREDGVALDLEEMR